ncbi:MAG: hypothetical protein ACRDBH_01740 [Bosea sp. (in: a-proteobacteria)]
MILLALTILLYSIVATMLLVAWRRQDGSARTALDAGLREFIHLLPRLAVGVIGSGFLAKALPQETVTSWLGGDSGLLGITLATIAGALTPGGPVVGYSLGSAALKAGAGLPQVMAYVTGWSLYTINRMLIWELPVMPRQVFWQRIIISLPLPFIIAGCFMLLPPGLVGR